MGFTAFLCSCPPSTLKPSITVTPTPGTLTINGSGFADISKCANLSVLGVPSPPANRSLGQAQCSGGAFQNFVWQYPQAASGCDLKAPPSTVSVFALDSQGSNAGASQSVSIGPMGSCGTSCCGADQKCADEFIGLCCAANAGQRCGHTGDMRGGPRCCEPNDTCTPDACCSKEVVCGVACLAPGSDCCDDSFPPKSCGPGSTCCNGGCCGPGTHCTTLGGVVGCSPI